MFIILTRRSVYRLLVIVTIALSEASFAGDISCLTSYSSPIPNKLACAHKISAFDRPSSAILDYKIHGRKILVTGVVGEWDSYSSFSRKLESKCKNYNFIKKVNSEDTVKKYIHASLKKLGYAVKRDEIKIFLDDSNVYITGAFFHRVPRNRINSLELDLANRYGVPFHASVDSYRPSEDESLSVKGVIVDGEKNIGLLQNGEIFEVGDTVENRFKVLQISVKSVLVCDKRSGLVRIKFGV